jgi:hypothetical protein
MREARCAVNQRRLDPEGTQQELRAIHQVEGGDFDPEEGFEWPFPDQKEDGEEVVVR